MKPAMAALPTRLVGNPWQSILIDAGRLPRSQTLWVKHPTERSDNCGTSTTTTLLLEGTSGRHVLMLCEALARLLLSLRPSTYASTSPTRVHFVFVPPRSSPTYFPRSNRILCLGQGTSTVARLTEKLLSEAQLHAIQ